MASRPPADAAAAAEHLIPNPNPNPNATAAEHPIAPAAPEAEAERLPVGLLLAMIGCGSLEVP